MKQLLSSRLPSHPVLHALAGVVVTGESYILIGLLCIFLSALPLTGCTGKSIALYNPKTGAPIAKYTNTTDTEIGGLTAEFNEKTGAFKVQVESSSQAASASNKAIYDTLQAAINKIPSVPLVAPGMMAPGPCDRTIVSYVRPFADINQDGGVDGFDLETFFTDWEGESWTDLNQDDYADADIDGDGSFTPCDIALYVSLWVRG